jgi:hypothetical protein
MVDDVATGDRCEALLCGEAQPQVPIFDACAGEPLVKTTGLLERGAAHQHRGRDDEAFREELWEDIAAGHRSSAPYAAAGLIDHFDAAIENPRVWRALRLSHCCVQPARAPSVIGIEEGNPGGTAGKSPGVARSSGAAEVELEDPCSRRPRHGGGVVSTCIGNDRDARGLAALGEG